MTPGPGEIRYLVLPDADHPYLLARVRWPDVFQAMSPVRPDWLDDPGLFDLAHDPAGVPVTAERAAAIAAEWGVELPTDAVSSGMPDSSLIRRMPADWSNLSRAERRAWSIEFVKAPKPAKSSKNAPHRARRRQGHRRGIAPAPEPIIDLTAMDDHVDIDLTEFDVTGSGANIVLGVENA